MFRMYCIVNRTIYSLRKHPKKKVHVIHMGGGRLPKTSAVSGYDKVNHVLDDTDDSGDAHVFRDTRNLRFEYSVGVFDLHS